MTCLASNCPAERLRALGLGVLPAHGASFVVTLSSYMLMLELYNEFWRLPIQDQGHDCKAPFNVFEFGAYKFWKDSQQSRLNQSTGIHRDLRSVGAQGVAFFGGP